MDEYDKRPRYESPISGNALPLIALLTVVIRFLLGDGYTFTQSAWVTLFVLLIHISLFYAVLLMVMPLLRQVTRAGACALIWLLPFYLFMGFGLWGGAMAPVISFKLPRMVLNLLGGIWLIGAIAVFSYHLMVHLRFRREILADVVPVEEGEIWQVWQQEWKHSNLRRRIPLVISKQVTTPLSIGIYHRTTYVILPDRPYTAEELQMIFRHELVHISHGDGGNKMFLAFCTACCWFNPLMWLAMRKSAEDLELSCDETVLIGADAEKRKKYAALILHTAGEKRGFTTYLSSTGRAVRYRLKHIVGKRKVLSGSLLVTLTLFVFLMSHGYLRLGYDAGTVGDIFFGGKEEQYTIRSLRYMDGEGDTSSCKGFEEAGLKEYISGLECSYYTVYAEDPTQYEPHWLRMTVERGEEEWSITMKDGVILLFPVNRSGEHEKAATTYALESEVDWEYVESLLIPEA